MKHTDTLVRIVVTLFRTGAGLSFAVLIATVLLQVVSRIEGSSPVWTEELTRYALLYMVAFGSGLAFMTGDLVNVDVISESLPGRLPWMLRILAALSTAGLTLYLLPHAWRYVSIGQMQTAPALGVRMHYVHFTVWLMLAGLALFAVVRLVGMVAGTDDGLPNKPEQEE